MVRTHRPNPTLHHLVSLACLMLLVAVGGCTAIPGVGVPASAKPLPGWSDAKLRETFGTPSWERPGPKGTKVLYFGYKTAPNSRALAAATAITTFGLVRDAGSLDYQLVAIVDSAGRLVCADRARHPYGDVDCEHERRLAVLDGLPDPERGVYDSMLRVMDPKTYVPGYYAVVEESALAPDAIVAAIETGKDKPAVQDSVYYFNAQCYLLTRWHAKHLEASRQDTAAATEAAIRFGNGVYEAGGSRGYDQSLIDDDIGLYVPAMQRDLNNGRASPYVRQATICQGATTTSEWTTGMGITDSAIYERVTQQIDLAKSLLRHGQPQPAEKPDNYYYLRFLPTPNAVDETAAATMLAKQKVLQERVTLDAIAEPLYIYDTLFTEILRNGNVPSRDLVRRLMVALDAKIAIGDHTGVVQALANIGRYYLANTPNTTMLSRGATVLVAAASMADYQGDYDSAASLALMAGEVRLASVGIILANNGLANEESRDNVREIVNFVPYSYERTAWDGTVTRYTVNAAPFDAQGMFALISEIGRHHVAAQVPLGYAVSMMLPPAAAGDYFIRLGDETNERFSTLGASQYYLLAHIAFEAAGNNLQATVAELFQRTNYVASQTRSETGRKNACASYATFRQEFNANFNKPSREQVADLFGTSFATQMRRYDKRCKVR
ncbi:MAG: hypothetical protein AAGH76_09000 [Pseudomonadota bacterium]